MSSQQTCGACNGTGLVTVYEPWEHARARIQQDIEFAERVGREVISLDVEGCYPTTVVWPDGIYSQDTPAETVDRVLGYWPKRLGPGGWDTDLPVSPYNDRGGSYEPPDARFYDESIPWPEVTS